MKLTLERDGESCSVAFDHDDVSIDEMLEVFRLFLSYLTFSADVIDRHIPDPMREYEITYLFEGSEANCAQ